MKNNNLFIIDHPRFFRRGNLRRQLLARDGLHLSEQGTRQLASDIMRQLNPTRKQKLHFPTTKPRWTEVLATVADNYPSLPPTTVAVDIDQLHWPTKTTYASKLKPVCLTDDFPPLSASPNIRPPAFDQSYAYVTKKNLSKTKLKPDQTHLTVEQTLPKTRVAAIILKILVLVKVLDFLILIPLSSLLKFGVKSITIL